MICDTNKKAKTSLNRSDFAIELDTHPSLKVNEKLCFSIRGPIAFEREKVVFKNCRLINFGKK